jgi:succinate-semialdehyde dehydrogenase / glutarate-semialdehyde dehydrogenase
MATATASAPTDAPSTGRYRQQYIDGQWCDASNGKRLKVINPATEEQIAEIAFGGREDCARALEAAHRAMPAWMKLSAWDRAKVLKKTAELMRERADGLARTLTMEQGKPVAGSQGRGAALGRYLRVVRRGRQARLRAGHPQ